MMHRLHRDIFLDLLPFVDGPSIIRLYATGDSMIMNCIESCLTSISLELKRYSDLRWPNLLSRFSHVKSLELTCGGGSSSIMGASIDNLLQSLERLLLEFRGSSLLCFELVDESSPDGPWKTRESLSSSRVKDLICRTAPYSPMKIGPELISTLPSSLVSINLMAFGFMKSSYLSLLPQGLESLSCLFTPEQTDLPNWFDFFAFPPLLTYLVIKLPSVSRTVVICDNFLASLPSSLVTLRIEPNKVVARKFPSNLTSFGLYALQLDESLAKALPPRLNHLMLSTSLHDDPASYQWLPKTLTQWDSYNSPPPPVRAPETLLSLPSSLTMLPLHLSSCYNTPSDWKYWRSPKSFMDSSSFPYSISIDALDPTLTSYLEYIPRCTAMDISTADLEILKAIPNSVTSLTVRGLHASDIGINYDHISHLDRLEVLEIGSFKLDLPAPFLSFSQNGPDRAFLTNLKRLNLSQNINICDTSTSTSEQSLWSRNLQSLSLTPILPSEFPVVLTADGQDTKKRFIDSRAILIGQWVQNLPSTHLTSLYLQSDSFHLPASTWMHLPRTLTILDSLRMHIDSDLENCFRALPSHLYRLQCSRCTVADPSLIIITPSLMKAIPAYLRLFYFKLDSEQDKWDLFYSLLSKYCSHLSILH